ncbi:MAG: SusD/RagB family nutrient-binding outer membrane lipoprotein [Bacteroidota bacterium]
MKKIQILGMVLLAVGVIGTGCNKDLDINSNPNSVTESNITPELILPNALNGVGIQSALGYGWLNNWMGYWSPSGSYSPNTEESTYNLTASFGENKWDGIYNVLFDLDNVEKRSDSSKMFYVGIAKICKAHLYQNLVDLFGNVPYSEAFNSAENATPAYDDAKAIYDDLQLQLDTAISIMQQEDVPTGGESYDIVFHGDQTLWTKFANTIKLRLLIRQSEVPGFSPTAEISKITANGAGFLGAGESAEADPGYLNAEGKQNPYFATYGEDQNGIAANEYYRANNYVLNILKDNNDERTAYFFAPATAPLNAGDPYVGTTYGGAPDVDYGGTRTSNIGAGLVKSFDQPQWILTSVESLFLQAEAIARGWLPGDVQTAYETALRESFSWLGVEDPVETANLYLEDPDSPLSWDHAGGSPQSQINFIVFQKYVSLTGINPLEAWNDYRRLGIPSDNTILSINPARGSRRIPVRLPYPASEVAVNAENVSNQGEINYQSTRLFWDVN